MSITESQTNEVNLEDFTNQSEGSNYTNSEDNRETEFITEYDTIKTIDQTMKLLDCSVDQNSVKHIESLAPIILDPPKKGKKQSAKSRNKGILATEAVVHTNPEPKQKKQYTNLVYRMGAGQKINVDKQIER